MVSEDTATVELPVSDWESLLAVLELRVKEEKRQLDADGDSDVVDTLTLLYEEIDRQLASHPHVDRVDGLSTGSDDG